ncbi:hypothetical protein D3C84_71320 [compost metagenome]
MQAAQLLAGHARTTAEHRARTETAWRGQIGAGAQAWLGETQLLTAAHAEGAPGLQGLAVQGGAEVGAGQGQAAVLLAAQVEIAQGDFHHHGVQGVAQQPVGPVHGNPVQGAALADAEVAHAETPGVLQLDKGAAALDAQPACVAVHRGVSRGLSSPPRRMNSA